MTLHFPHGVMTHGLMIPTFKFPVSTSVPCNNGNCYKEAHKMTNCKKCDFKVSKNNS